MMIFAAAIPFMFPLLEVPCAEIARWDTAPPIVVYHHMKTNIKPVPSPDRHCYLCIGDGAIKCVLLPGPEVGS